MNDTQRRRYERAVRVSEFVESLKGELPAAGRAAQSAASVKALIGRVAALDASQSTNAREKQAGTEGKAAARQALRELLGRIGRTARAIGRDDPALKGNFRLPATNPNEQTLLGTARSFRAAAEPFKARFVEYGMAADFLDALDRRVGEIESFGERQRAGTSGRAGDLAATESALEELDAEVARLDAYVRNAFAADAARLESWRQAARLERAPRRPKVAAGRPSPGVSAAGN